MTKDYAAALVDFSKAIELKPDNGSYYRWRGRCLYETQDYVAALADFSKAIELQSDDFASYYWRGRARIEAGNPNDALDDLDRTTAAASPRSERALACVWRAVAGLIVGHSDEAREKLALGAQVAAEALASAPRDMKLIAAYIVVHAAIGEISLAEKELEIVSKLDITSIEAKRARHELESYVRHFPGDERGLAVVLKLDTILLDALGLT